MHTSFTGSTKKARQVNLQGRANVNPWSKTAGLANTIAQAQAEREKRALDRRRLNAAKNIQRVWRGHAGRRRKQSEWRQQWDESRAAVTASSKIERSGGRHTHQQSDFERVRQSLMLLLHFFNIWSVEDHTRLLDMAESLNVEVQRDMLASLPLEQLGVLLARALEIYDQVAQRSQGVPPAEVDRYLGSLLRVTQSIPHMTRNFASKVFAALTQLLKSWMARTIPIGTQQLFADNAIFCLHHTQGDTLTNIYVEYAKLLTVTELYLFPETLDMLVQSTDLELLARAIIEKTAGPWLTAGESGILLSYLAYSRESQCAKGSKSAPVLIAMTTLLALSESTFFEDADAGGTPDVVREQLHKLPKPRSIDQFLEDIASLQVDPASSAKIMSKYALSLLRAFPGRAYDIRMRIFLNPTSITSSDRPLTSIQYFWEASQQTEIFTIVTQSQKNVLALLKPDTSSETYQIGRPSLTVKRNSPAWKDDWRLILFFLEMYTSALKLMDDEEFFSSDGFPTATMNGIQQDSRQSRGSLPLSDVVRMVTFLKNLTYTLYWSTAELSRNPGSSHELSVQLGYSTSNADTRSLNTQPDLAGLEGVTQSYLKGLTTGVLRMLHERDSRRKFLLDNAWLMTSQVDMNNFIPEVVHEEEKRLTLGDVEEEEESDDDLDETAANSTTDWSSRFRSQTRSGGLGLRQPEILNRFARKHERAQRRNQVAAVAPRLELLRNLPFFIPFETRVNIFRQFVHNDQYRRRNGAIDPHVWRMTVEQMELGRGAINGRELLSRHTAKIRRDSVFSDAFAQFYPLGEGLKEPIYIKFFDSQGIEERGIDGGGVTKEFLTSITSQAFSPSPPGLSWFVENDQHYLHPNADLHEIVIERNRRIGHELRSEVTLGGIRDLKKQYEFMGRVVGKCLYEGILIDVRFAGFFLLKWALTGGTTSATNETAYRPTLNDMRDMDPDIYHHLLALKTWSGNVEEDFGLNFTITDNMTIDAEGNTFSKTRELIQDGANTPVTNANRLLYIDRFVRYRLQHHPKVVTDAFLKGLGQMIEPMWLAMFNQKELQWLIGGDDSELDLVDLRRNTELGGIYQRGDDPQDHPTIEMFWNVLREMNDKDRREILRFATSTPRAPLLGFSNLHPRFSIRDSTNDEGRHDLNRLPTSSTCVNQLKLPPYKNKAQMREKLLYAAKSGAGFDLS
jgi:ubiquitin-protein ligase E3 C